MTILKPEPLTRSDFAAFGDVIETDGAQHYPINQGFAERFHDLARIDCSPQGGETIVSIFRGNPRPVPIEIALMERHPLGSQAFYPLNGRDWLIVVAQDPASFETFRAFRAGGRQGVNYARNVWHHPLLVLDAGAEFLIVDRKGPGDNLIEMAVPGGLMVECRGA